jgi:hypothetical protein
MKLKGCALAGPLVPDGKGTHLVIELPAGDRSTHEGFALRGSTLRSPRTSFGVTPVAARRSPGSCRGLNTRS